MVFNLEVVANGYVWKLYLYFVMSVIYLNNIQQSDNIQFHNFLRSILL